MPCEIMSLTIGTHLGSHEITALLGKGGMGEVYRARDTKLKRDVAIKVLPDEFSRDGERLSRFQREAEVLALLNHPNIAAIYDLEEANATRFLVLELVEGETLADRIRRGPLPVEEALEIGRHICEALEAAHEKSIVHRDLKPANVKITPDDKVKVLDFGLAKAMEGAAPANATLSNSPTLSLAATQAGVILGTAAYMSPEQAKGIEVDARSDVFSFGCVLYEMLTGRQAFHGESVSEIIAAVLIREPDFSGLPPNLNPRIQELLQRCLQKNAKRRWQAVGDLVAELESVAEAPRLIPTSTVMAVPPRPLWRRAIPVAAALALSVMTGILAWNLKPAVHGSVTRFALVLPQEQTMLRTPSHLTAISRDGTKLVYSASGQLFLRDMSQMETKPISGTEGSDPVRPFFSPDGQWVGFYSFRDSALKKIPISGGAAITICKTNAAASASWNGEQVVFYDPAKGILRVSAEGGEPQILVPNPPEGSAYYPQMVDGGRAVLFTLRRPESEWDQSQIVVQSLVSGERKIVAHGSDGRYVASGHILYAVGGNVYALPFDVKNLRGNGSATPVIENVMRAGNASGVAQLSVSDNGTLIYMARGDAPVGVLAPTTLALVDRSGKTDTLPLPPAQYETPRISPDGHQIAVTIFDGKEWQISIYDRSSGATLRRLTFGGGRNESPVWSNDGKYIFFSSDQERSWAIFRQLADGTGVAERLTPEGVGGRSPTSLDRLGKILLFDSLRGAERDIFTVTLEGNHEAKPFVALRASVQAGGIFSPDGRWVAYMSNDMNGLPQIFVQPYPGTGTGSKYQVTKEGGAAPAWSRDGKQLFYVVGNKMFAVDVVRTEPALSFGKPSPLAIPTVQIQGAVRNYDVMPDGRFLTVLLPSQTQAKPPTNIQINVVLNWFTELQQRVPVK
jgi:serine/threonine-protein kinase